MKWESIKEKGCLCTFSTYKTAVKMKEFRLIYCFVIYFGCNINLIKSEGSYLKDVSRFYQHVKADSEIPKVTVFKHGEAGFPCIRTPAITKCGPKGTLHAFAGCRPWIGDGCIPSKPPRKDFQASLCYKNSTDDGATWSKLYIIQQLSLCPNAVCDKETNVILIQYQIESDGGSREGNWQVSSADDGATWSQPQRINLGKYRRLNPGPGLGLQLSAKSVAPGRILFAGYHGRYEWATVWYSDDGGKTYNTSESLMEHMAEPQIVELSDGSVMANMRNRHQNPCDCRGIAISRDGGRTFSNVTYDHTLISPTCQGTIISMNNGSLIFANPASKKKRENGMVRRSDNNGKTWSHNYPVTTKQYAYSCLTHVAKEDEVGLLWETEAEGCTGPSCQVVFSKLKVL